MQLFQELVLIAELRILPRGKGLDAEPDWLVETLSWFIPAYDLMKFGSKADMILGGDSTSPVSTLPGPHRTTTTALDQFKQSIPRR